MKKIYLAGPEVFSPNAVELGEQKVLLCKQYGFKGLWPLDNEIDFGDDPPNMAHAIQIYHGNVDMMQECDFCIANISPFRGPNVDDGTAFEIGFLTALTKPILAYSNDTNVTYIYKVAKFLGVDKTGRFDYHGNSIEPFGGYANLMIDVATQVISPTGEQDGDIFSLKGFEQCLKAAIDNSDLAS